MSYAIKFEDVVAASQRIKDAAHVTPVVESLTLSEIAGRQLFFKCECFQKVGAFKFRGAYNSAKLITEQANGQKRVLVTHSSGNHAQALALASKLCGADACIVMPDNAPSVKRNGVVGYGAKVVQCPSTQKDREETANRVMKENAPYSVLVPPYDYAPVMAGQGTIALELLNQVKDLDGLIVPVGGGGMLSGICIAAKAINPRIRIWAAEPSMANDCAESIQKNTIVPAKTTFTVADGLRTCLGELTWPIIRDHIDGVILVSEDEILSAMRLFWERMKILIEPSSAVAVAASFSPCFRAGSPELPANFRKFDMYDGRIKNYGHVVVNHLSLSFKDIKPADLQHFAYRQWKSVKKIGIVLSGGNVELDQIPFIKNKL